MKHGGFPIGTSKKWPEKQSFEGTLAPCSSAIPPRCRKQGWCWLQCHIRNCAGTLWVLLSCEQGQAEQNLGRETANTLHRNSPTAHRLWSMLPGDFGLPWQMPGPNPRNARWEKPPATLRTCLWVRMTGDAREKRWRRDQLTRMWSSCSARKWWWSWGSCGNKCNNLRLQCAIFQVKVISSGWWLWFIIYSPEKLPWLVRTTPLEAKSCFRRKIWSPWLQDGGSGQDVCIPKCGSWSLLHQQLSWNINRSQNKIWCSMVQQKVVYTEFYCL